MSATGPNPESLAGRIRTYFQEKYAGRLNVDEMNKSVREDIQGQFSVSNAYWYSLRNQLLELDRLARSKQPAVASEEAPFQEDGEDAPFVIDIPSDLSPTAKAAFGRILGACQNLRLELVAKEAELASAKYQAVMAEKRIKVLKETGELLMGSM